ncbi:hypothetical protein FACS1894147_01060 [Spirochaetia bacterium]|nr:hypothetical protein FACS1894147_01060 [Spirochaetia bacterium]
MVKRLTNKSLGSYTDADIWDIFDKMRHGISLNSHDDALLWDFYMRATIEALKRDDGKAESFQDYTTCDDQYDKLMNIIEKLRKYYSKTKLAARFFKTFPTKPFIPTVIPALSPGILTKCPFSKHFTNKAKNFSTDEYRKTKNEPTQHWANNLNENEGLKRIAKELGLEDVNPQKAFNGFMLYASLKIHEYRLIKQYLPSWVRADPNFVSDLAVELLEKDGYEFIRKGTGDKFDLIVKKGDHETGVNIKIYQDPKHCDIRQIVDNYPHHHDILLTNAADIEGTSDLEIIDFPYLIQKYSSELSEEKLDYIVQWFSDNLDNDKLIF